MFVMVAAFLPSMPPASSSPVARRLRQGRETAATTRTSAVMKTRQLTAIDEEHMQFLVDLAKAVVPTRPFAASIVDRGRNQVLCTGVNDSPLNPTLHGEIAAINNCSALYGFNKTEWHNYTLYTTAESCPMCQSGV